MIENNILSNIPLGRIMGIDYGQKRVGIAISDPLQRLSSAHSTLDNTAPKKTITKIVELVMEHSIIAVIIGMPVNMDGTKGEKAELVDKVLNKIDNRLPEIPVLPWDERWSTKSAQDILIAAGKSPSKNRHIIDQIAAEVILQSFLDRLDYYKRTV